MFELSLGVLFLIAVLAFGSWRHGLALCAVMAVLQDVLRKLTPNEPAYFVLFSGVVFGAAAIGALMSGRRLTPRAVQGWQSHVGAPFSLFVVLVVLQAVHSLLRFGIPQMTVIGLIAYLAPIPAIVFAYQFAMRKGIAGLRAWMWLYVVAAGVALSGVYLEYLGFGWAALGEVGEGLTIHGVGTILKAYSGFFRSSEIAAWHTAAVSSFLFILLIGRRFNLSRWVIAVALIALLASLGILTGRRKVLVMVAVFICAYFFLVAWFQNHATRPALFAAAAGILVYVVAVGMMAPDPSQSEATYQRFDANDRYQQYSARGKSVFGDIPKRFDELGIQPVMWAVNGYGVFGAGLGTGSQGVQHVSAASSINRGAAEGGLGKITMELGLPGLLLVGWLAVAFARYIRQVLTAVTRLSPQHARITYGLVAFLMANIASFSVATQAFGDIYVLMMMGWAVGFVLAMPVLAERDMGITKERTIQAGSVPIHRRAFAR
jgi:hypothetical protein